jgi:hypothetical protein
MPPSIYHPGVLFLHFFVGFVSLAHLGSQDLRYWPWLLLGSILAESHMLLESHSHDFASTHLETHGKSPEEIHGHGKSPVEIRVEIQA